jgi:hypothetical protein
MKWLILILLLFVSSEAQEKHKPASYYAKDTLIVPSVRLDRQRTQVFAVFRKIEQGIRVGMVNEYKDEFGGTVSVAMGAGERGYFSTNQAISVLAGYFSGRRPVSFEFSRIHEKGSVPYATGRFVFVQKGNQESAQMYVSLTRQNSRWLINQFNIY